MKRWLILGATGQLGLEFRRRLPEATAWDHAAADFLQPHAWLDKLEALRPDVVLNAVSYNTVDAAESDPERVFAINAFTPRLLAQVCARLGSTLVHFSTNLVFGLGSDHAEPLGEEDPAEPLSVYGSSKLAGENFVRTLCPRHLVIRTAGLLGHRPQPAAPWNFVEKIRHAAQTGAPLRIVTDQYAAPTGVADLAQAALNLVEIGAGGLFHLNGSVACSWHEYARAILVRCGLKARLEAVTTQEFALPARRPLYSVLSNRKYTSLGFPEPRGWPTLLAEYLGGSEAEA